ncbi:MAG: ABC transporter ATP-binding protein [Roseateles depolymerans]|uniref:ABC transporter ATP-binding protein n=1 Tax=Roseateles depolymerans TaxID=76731 RepID=A0A2W5F827_9BURK|nr:MAG: ABC transporter ATP-binding protein [Roseateles depolymerans]
MTDGQEAALRVSGLRKAYGARQAVADVAFELRPGEVLGLLGPNGAGKSTTVGMISGLTVPDAGQVQLRGGLSLAADEAAYKRRIGLVPQDIALFDELPARHNVELFGALYGLPAAQRRQRADAVLAQVGLLDRAADRPATFSGGMKRRLNIACALVHDPEVILLDEPTAGVDPQSRNAIFDHLEALKAAGKALIYTTHYMEEAERLADRIVIIDHGRVVASGTQADLFARLPAAQTLQLELDGEVADAALAGLAGVRRTGQRLELSVADIAADSAALLAELARRGVAVRRISSERATLEDVFLALTGRQLRD